ncbi:GNAT family N-acetyltransferase [Haloplanus sp.]|uniref:GNAT family N-acetyltransferase n=1 Tax=Haloplanus sp. TaxID=1961696 RepID=UPI00260D1911|nr:GNAT family N-acetyltransferase [Haloplanus sp.]
MEFALLGWSSDGPTLRLDHRRFAYAGKFVVGSTGKAVGRATTNEGDAPDTTGAPNTNRPPNAAVDTDYDDDVLAAASFSADRTDHDRLCIRYVTVRSDRRGEGLGSRLLAFVAARAADRGYDRVRIAVNNPAAYRAAYRAGFAFTGAETGLAELVCERPATRPTPRDADIYRNGLDRYRERELDDETAAELADARAAGPPDVVDPPGGTEPGR